MDRASLENAMNLESVRAKLKEIRVERGLSLQQVTERAGWGDPSTAAQIEKSGGDPCLVQVQRYALALGVKHAELRVASDKPLITTFWNFAGGVSKTVLVRDVGYLLAKLGFKVLLVDTDPQANLTHWLGLTSNVTMDETIYPAIIGDEDALHLPAAKQLHGVHLIPSQMNLATVEMTLPSVVMGIMRLRDALTLQNDYDFVLIDSPPSLGSLSALAGVAAQRLIIPVPTNSKGLENFATIMNAIKNYRRARPELDIGLFVPTQYDPRTKLNREHLELIHERLTQYAPIAPPLSFRPGPYGKAQVLGEPVPSYAPHDKATDELHAVTDALLKALGVSLHVET